MSEPSLIRRRTLLAGAAAFGLSVPGFRAASAQPVVAGSRWRPHGWSLVPSLSDDFTHPSSTHRWNRGLWYPVSGVGTFTDGNVSFAHGRLRLTATPGEPAGPAYRFGAVESFFDLPGVCSYVEVRAQVLDSRARVLSAIWQQSSNYDHVDRLLEGADPNPEIDVEETFSYDGMDMATHTWGAAGHIAFGGSHYSAGVDDISQGFHTYGIERLDDHLRFYFDRQLAWDLPAPHPSLARMSRHQVLSLEGHLGSPNPQYLPASFVIDYVHTYYRTAGRRAQSGWYHLVNAATGDALGASDLGGLEWAAPASTRRGPVWLARETPDHTYVIVHRRRHQMLALEDGQGQPGVPVVAERASRTGPDNVGSRRRWHVLPGPDGLYSLRSKFSGLAIDAADGTLRQQEATGAATQLWLLRKAR